MGRRYVLLLCILASLQTVGAQLGDTTGVDDGTNNQAGTKKSVEVNSYFTEFTRVGPYPYQVCADLPGEIGETDATKSARCIPVEPGELEFCATVAYDTCSRVISPILYDEQIAKSHDERLARWELEFPALVTTECTEAFKLYFCLLAFPRCEEDTDNLGSFLELPLCFDYCVNAHMACIGDDLLSRAACDKAVVLGRVAPPRGDVTCVSGARSPGASMVYALALALLSWFASERGSY
jgi:hypothetical protein